MLFSIFKHELKRIFTGPAVYIFFVLLIWFSFQDAQNVVQGRTVFTRFGHSWHNAPLFITRFLTEFTFLGVLFSIVLIGKRVTQDFDVKVQDFYFTSPISKFSYLFGRFFAGLSANIFIYLGVVVGSLIGWGIIDDKFTGPISLVPFMIAFIAIVIPNLLLIGSTFFAFATLTRNMFISYLVGVVFIIAYFVGRSSLDASDSEILRILMDPSGMLYLNLISEFWTVTEINTLAIPFDSRFLLNRAIWIGVSILMLALTYVQFHLHTHKKTRSKKIKTC